VSRGFVSDLVLSSATWQGFERLVCRLLLASGYEHVMLVGQSGDGGADVLALKGDKRWLFQVKRWVNPVGPAVLTQTIEAMARYGADVPVVVSRAGYEAGAYTLATSLSRQGIPIQLWDRPALAKRGSRLPEGVPVERSPFALRDYQEGAVRAIVGQWLAEPAGNALVVLATGLGKTVVAAESFRRMNGNKPGVRALVLAHRNELVYQLERAFWPMLATAQETAVWNGTEKPDQEALHQFTAIFACVDSVDAMRESGAELPAFDLVVVDECHHLGASTYERVLDALHVGEHEGPFLLGLTATPWRPTGEGLDHRFDSPAVSIDLVEGLRRGFLANVDYRIYTDNVDWDELRDLHGDRFSPRVINRTLFIDEWDDAAVTRVADAWMELPKPRGIVFCGTIEHAERMASRINALGFARAEPIYSRSSKGVPMSVIERSRLIWDFADGKIGILCAVDVLNEGIDAPDVNLVVFQRVTHSRRIFVQQLGRGLRLSPGKDKVIVLDFVSDVRRFAAGLDLKHALDSAGPRPGQPVRVKLPSKVTFFRANSEDEASAGFLQAWLGDLAEVEDAGDDVSVLRFPPLDALPEARQRT
jgi:superfamily II DNA or RNA helicase